jgi:hypothetical protein
MKRIAINGKFLLMINEHAERLADIIEKRTGHRPNITTARNFDSQPNVSFGIIKPNYGDK